MELEAEEGEECVEEDEEEEGVLEEEHSERKQEMEKGEMKEVKKEEQGVLSKQSTINLDALLSKSLLLLLLLH